MNDFETGFTLQLFHLSDQEANTTSTTFAPNLSAVYNVLEAQDIDGDGTAGYADTLFLSSGDVILPGLFLDASETIYGVPGAADILIQNELGIQAIAFGNHEFDLGNGLVASLLTGDVETPDGGLPFDGANFPYLAGNLDFSADADLGPLVTADHQDATDIAGQIAQTTIVETSTGERIGVVGAVTPTLSTITSVSSDTLITPPGTNGPFNNASDADIAALAAVIQEDVDALLAANPDLDKVILLAHMQELNVEETLATLLTDVDIIVAGGSNSILLDENDLGFGGETADDVYPLFFEDAAGEPVAVVNTDRSYEYLGRLVIDFDENGNVIPESYDPDISGAYSTDDAGLAAIGATAADADPEIVAIADDVRETIVEGESTFFAVTDFFLNAERFSAPGERIDGVRSQETNLGNLTADANLAVAQSIDPTVVVSYKNGGGIRANIGTITQPGGGGEPQRLPPEGVDGAKPEGGISQNDVANALAFNNGLALITVTGAQLIEIAEGGVADFQSVDTEASGFAHWSGIEFAYDPDLPAGDRIVSMALVNPETGEQIQELIRGGEVVDGVAEQEFRMVTLDFLLNIGDPTLSALMGADRAALNENLITAEDDAPRTGGATFAPDNSEQDALAEYLLTNFGNQEGDPTVQLPDTEIQQDERIQNLNERPDTVLDDDALTATRIATFQGDSDPADEDSPEGASEVVDFEDGVLYTTNGNLDRIDVLALGTMSLTQTGFIDLTTLENYDGVQSLAVSDGILAVAADTALVNGEAGDGTVAFYNTETFELIDTVAVGSLPDQLVWTPDGSTLLSANEAEFNSESDNTNDPVGSVSIINVDRSGETPSFSETRLEIDQAALDLIGEGLRTDPNLDPVAQAEPEYISVSPDGSTAFVALQESNAALVIDLATGSFAGGLGFGTVDHSQDGNEFDALDDELIDIVTRDTLGLRMPDAHVAFEVGGTLYLATANEGDGRGDAVDGGDEARVQGLLDGEVPGIGIDPLVDTEGLERLIVSTVDGDTDGDGDIDVLHSFGGRGFTIFNLATGAVAFEAGSDLELLDAAFNPDTFLDDDGEAGQNRADSKGVEAEAIAFGEVGGTPYVFVGAERTSSINIFDVSDPTDAKFVDFVDTREMGDVSPEIITFIPREESSTGNPQIAVSFEISGTTSVYDLTIDPTGEMLQASYVVGLGRLDDPLGFAFWDNFLDDDTLSFEEVVFAHTDSQEFADMTSGQTTAETVAMLSENATGEAPSQAEIDDLSALAQSEGFDAVVLQLIDDNFMFA